MIIAIKERYALLWEWLTDSDLVWRFGKDL